MGEKMKDKRRRAEKDMKPEKKQRKEKLKSFAIDLGVLLVACCVSAFSTVGVMIPNGLTSGGITGIARILQSFLDVDFSILYYGLSMIVIILVMIFMGWKELRKILLLSIMYPAVLFLFERLDIRLLETKDILLAAVFCGIFTGIYIGLVFWRGYSSAGTDAVAKIVRKRIAPRVGLSKILLCIDAVIIIGSALVYGRNIALYALITQVIITKTSETIMYGFESKIVQLSIITSNEKSEEICQYIIQELNRSATSFEVRGEYSGTPQRQVMVLCSSRESVLVKKKLAEIDPQAFVMLAKMETVWGTGRDFGDIGRE